LTKQQGRLALRLAFLALLGGGLVLWTQLRRPRDLRVDLDLTRALPGEIVEVDVVVRRDGRALGRTDETYGRRGAPATVHVTVRAAPGAAEVEATLVTLAGARRTRARVQLDESAPAVVRAE
jgi:hypothetical protein